MANDLKPCPLCGSSRLARFVSVLPINDVHCEDCGHEGPNTSDAFGAAEEAWNDAAAGIGERVMAADVLHSTP